MQPQLPSPFLTLPPAHASSWLPTSPVSGHRAATHLDRMAARSHNIPNSSLNSFCLSFIYFCLLAALIVPIPNVRQSVPPPPLVPAERAWTALTHSNHTIQLWLGLNFCLLPRMAPVSCSYTLVLRAQRQPHNMFAGYLNKCLFAHRRCCIVKRYI